MGEVAPCEYDYQKGGLFNNTVKVLCWHDEKTSEKGV